jgi:hypothetical protein
LLLHGLLHLHLHHMLVLHHMQLKRAVRVTHLLYGALMLQQMHLMIIHR